MQNNNSVIEFQIDSCLINGNQEDSDHIIQYQTILFQMLEKNIINVKIRLIFIQ
jgi:hypothetical protein